MEYQKKLLDASDDFPHNILIRKGCFEYLIELTIKFLTFHLLEINKLAPVVSEFVHEHFSQLEDPTPPPTQKHHVIFPRSFDGLRNVHFF